jgi:flagellar M-ring protein FliF
MDIRPLRSSKKSGRMNVLAQAEQIWSNLKALGLRKLTALALIGLGVFAATGLAGLYLSRPTSETLYSGLDRDDIVSIGAALKEAAIPFDVNAEGNTVLVPAGQAALARMTLAEKGLPHGGGVGNELYDKLGSLGLTSFMQEVTRVRAVEGELARTIQMMRGVKAARVHIVLGDEGSFRREARPPSASVVVRSDRDNAGLGRAIRHLVAAAIPNMSSDAVTVLDVDGRLLASGTDSMDKAPDNLLSLERSVAQDIRETVGRTLTPYLNSRNFQVSVAARLNVDKKQISETIYNPDQRVERSVRVTKESQNSQNAAGTPAAGVDANVPKPKNTSASVETKQSSDQNQKREELTNYEVSSKATTITSSGFTIDRLSVAMLVNRAALVASLGGKPSAEAIDQQVRQIEQLVSSAAGLRTERGDTVKVAVVDFADDGRELEPAPGPTISETLVRQSGTLINALSMVAIAAMVIWFGVRPATRALLLPPPSTAEAESIEFPGVLPPSLEAVMAQNMAEEPFLIETNPEPDGLIAELLAHKDASLERRLEKLIDFDEERAAMVLKQWIRKGAHA